MATLSVSDYYFNPHLTTGLDDGSSEANAWQTLASFETDITTIVAAAVAHEQILVNFKSNTLFVMPRYDDMAASGTVQNPIWVRGYTTTPGDNGFAYIGRTAGGAGGTGKPFSGSYVNLEGVVQDYTGVGYHDNVGVGNNGVAYRCRFLQSSGNYGCSGDKFFDCYIKTGGTSNNDSMFSRCYIEFHGTNLFDQDPFNAYGVYTNCIININAVTAAGQTIFTRSRPDDGFGLSFRNCRIIGSNDDANKAEWFNYENDFDGVIWRTTSYVHNIIWNCEKFMTDHATPTGEEYQQLSIHISGNAVESTLTNWSDYCGLGDGGIKNDQHVILTGNPYVDSSNGNFDLDPDGPDFAALIAAGFAEKVGFNWTTLLPESSASTGAPVSPYPSAHALGRAY